MNRRAVIRHHGDRFLVCRAWPGCPDTVEVDCPTAESAQSHAWRLQTEYDRLNAAPIPSNDPWEPKQIAFGFYTDSDAS